MLKRMLCLVIAAGAVAVMVAPAAAADRPGEKLSMLIRPAGTSEPFTPKLAKANELTGMPVRNPQGEQLGKLVNIVLNIRENRAACGIVMLDDRMHDVPWQAVCLSDDGKSLVVDIPLETFRQGPSFDMDSFPGFDRQWIRRNIEFYEKNVKGFGHRAAGMMKQAQRMMAEGGRMTGTGEEMSEETGESGREPARMRASDFRPLCHVIGLNVNGADGQRLGTLEEVIIDMNEGQLAYAIVSHAETAGAEEKYSAVPWDALHAEFARQAFAMNVTADVFNRNTYTDGDFARLSETSYAERLASAYGTEPYWQTYAYGPNSERLVAPWLEGSAYNRYFNAHSVRTVTGTVRSVGSYWPTPSAASGARLRIATSDGAVHTVYAGPWGYAFKHQFAPGRGQQVTVKAAQATVKGEKVWIASEITMGDKTLKLYDSQGAPQWNPSEITMPGNWNEIDASGSMEMPATER